MDRLDMDRASSEFTDIVIEAYSLLRQQRLVDIIQPIRENLTEGETGWEFMCVAKVPCPNPKKLPGEIILRVVIPETFPGEPVEFYPENVNAFPHQDAETGKLCLPEETLAPLDASRLVCYVKWALDWLKDAANGRLLQPGEPYELPDFSRKLLESPLPTNAPFIFEESPNSYEKWEPLLGTSGGVECYWGNGISAIFAVRFHQKDGLLVRESDFALQVLNKERKIEGMWFIVRDIRYERHRPPQTYGEIDRLCSSNNLNFYTLLEETWKLNNSNKFGILLIGFPIPDKVGEPFTEIHWQPLLIQNLKGFRSQKPKPRLTGSARKPRQIWKKLKENGCFSPSQQLPWGKVENIARDRLYARGAHPSKVQATSMVVFGCGALGCSIAELLARGGVHQMNLVDSDTIKFGNLCRHTLDGSSVGLNKALALAKTLSRANPLSRIIGYSARVPLDSQSDQALRQAIMDADILIDCTTSEAAFQWLNQYAVENGKRLISLFFNFHAELLTLCISGESISCRHIFKDLYYAVQQKYTPIDPEVYFYHPSKDEQIIEGAGCWHPSFPALNAHVQILAAHAVDIISHSIATKQETGIAAILKRKNLITQNGNQPAVCVKKVWGKDY
ncbi:hypothetical protein C6497_12410 [Candidatus Poribacteria bacterium]|nr:MAG: hypothetical protein C6497_12410 [Candidatus Poribacteria bacterium]